MNLADFVKCYDNVLPPDYCDFFIKFFEENKDVAERFDNDGAPNFSKLDFTGISDEELFNNINKSVAFMFHNHAQKYATEVGLHEFFPKDYSFELIRLKKYEVNDHDEFKLHVDIGDKASSSRFLNLFCYLNDVEEGGETTFPNLGISFKPKKGSLLIFPPNWFFPHTGEKPLSNSKYLLATNLHYAA